MPCGTHRRPLADDQSHRERKVSFFCRHVRSNQPGAGGEPKPPHGRPAGAGPEADGKNQESARKEAKAERCLMGSGFTVRRKINDDLTRSHVLKRWRSVNTVCRVKYGVH